LTGASSAFPVPRSVTKIISYYCLSKDSGSPLLGRGLVSVSGVGQGAGASLRLLLLSCNVRSGLVLAVGKAGWSGIQPVGGTASALSSTWGQIGPRIPDICCRCHYQHRPNTGAERADENRTAAADILSFRGIIRRNHLSTGLSCLLVVAVPVG
jgi:hypothetical protein